MWGGNQKRATWFNQITRFTNHWRPHGDSNAGFHLRRVTLYPLSYGGNGAHCTKEWGEVATLGR